MADNFDVDAIDRASGYIVGSTKQGVQIRAPLLKLEPYKVAFEVFQLLPELRVSQALDKFKIHIGDQIIYEGQAVTSNLIELGASVVCEATLEDAWVDATGRTSALSKLKGGELFGEFLATWEANYRVRSEFKAAVADLQTFLADMKLWLDQIELGCRRSRSPESIINTAMELASHTAPAITNLFENFERALAGIDGGHTSVYQNYAKRQLHRSLLCSPFLHRTYTKPLGYAGDYEMVNMICRNPFEGESLYAKLVNHWFIQQPPAEAHRNRITFLVECLHEAVLKAKRHGRQARIMSIGCGPAQEVQRFIAESELSDQTYFRLVDFNEETANYTQNILSNLKQQHHRSVEIEMVRKSVHQILKQAGRTAAIPPEDQFDFVYCAGLFDYLTDQTCHRLTNILHQQVRPGGMFVSTNVDIFNPRRLTMDYVMDWHLIYRDGRGLAALRPDGVESCDESVTSDDTGVNIYYTLRKPERERASANKY